MQSVKSYLCTIVMLFVLAVTSSGIAKPRMLEATTPDLAAIASEIIGSKVKYIASPARDPHYIQAKPSFMVILRRTKAILYTGMQLEIGWLPRLIQGAHNSNLRPGSPGDLNASEAITKKLEVPTGSVDRAMGDIHPQGNPHYLLNPNNGILVARWLANRLSELFPQKKEEFNANAEAFISRLENKIQIWEQNLASVKGTKVIANHKQWEYLADWLGLNIIDYVEDRPGIPPTAKHIQDLTLKIKNQSINFIIQANFSPSEAPAKLAARTGTTLIILPATVTGEKENRSYIGLFDTIEKQLLSAMAQKRRQ